ncbi:MAG TPA: LLM class flavin-dependent oxidoreductase [Actinomycetota bacterium]|nr:LLM class flavin-dependent oxidoreductase [Actinomycetota bacterium]
MAVRVGVGLFTGQVPPGSGRAFEQEYREALDLVRLAEALGFDAAWVSEHHGSSDGYVPSLLPVLGAFAAATERIRLGTGVLLAPFHHPLRLAEDAATVDLLSGGRLVLGLGLGWREEEFRMFGLPLRERVRRTVETVEVLRRAWTGRRFSYEGKVFRFDQVRVTPPPAQEGGPPIWLGGTAQAAVRRAGGLADGYLRTRGGGVEAMAAALALAEEGARNAGRDPEALAFGQLQNVFVWDQGDPWELVRDPLRYQLGVYRAWAEGDDTPARDHLVPRPPDDETLRRLTPVGDPHAVLHALRPMVEAFGSRREFHLVVRLHYPGMDFATAARAMELFGEKVLPALKGD